jgi:hypothetical protein
VAAFGLDVAFAAGVEILAFSPSVGTLDWRGPVTMSALPPKADIAEHHRDVRFVPEADIQAAFGYYCWWARVLKFVEHHP